MKRRTAMFGWLAAGTVVVIGGCNSQTPATTLRENGDRYYARGEYVAAAAEYGALADRYPGDWKAQYMLGQSLMETGRYEDASHALEIALTRRPQNVAIADALAECLHSMEADERLVAFLQERVDEEESVHAYLRLTMYSLELGDPDSAQAAVLTAIGLDDGTSVEPYLAAADLAERLGNIETALRRLRQAYGIDSTDERVIDRIRAFGEIPGPTIALPPGR